MIFNSFKKLCLNFYCNFWNALGKIVPPSRKFFLCSPLTNDEEVDSFKQGKGEEGLHDPRLVTMEMLEGNSQISFHK